MEVYSKILTKTDVSTRLEVNFRRLNDFFPAFTAGEYHQNLVAEDENGAEWTFVLCIRREGRHRKPCISQRSWLPFVKEKQAQVDDKAEFSRETDGANGLAGRYKIRVMKPVRLFNETIGYVPRIPNN